MEEYEGETEIEENIENLYKFSLKDEEYELCMKISNWKLEFKLQQKDIILNYCYNLIIGLEKINKLFHKSFKKNKEAFDYFDKIIKDRRVELIKIKEKVKIINLKLKNVVHLENGNDIILELKQMQLTNEEMNIIILK